MTRETARKFLPPTLADVDAWLFQVPDKVVDDLPTAGELDTLPLES